VITLLTETNLAAFNAVLTRYMDATGKLPDDVLDKKGRDLGIKLFQGFSDHKFGGPGKKKSGLAKAQLAARTTSGEGTKVRASLLKEYFARRGQLRASAKSTLGNIKRRIRLWQSIVGREIALRQRGIGVLAASFLWFRGRSSQAKGTYYVRNKTGAPLGSVEKGSGFLRILGFTEGLSSVDARYSIVIHALAEAREDMLAYVERKERELIRAAERFAA
jgi:hypothetical protein